jgi:hypothetical protein
MRRARSKRPPLTSSDYISHRVDNDNAMTCILHDLAYNLRLFNRALVATPCLHGELRSHVSTAIIRQPGT